MREDGVAHVAAVALDTGIVAARRVSAGWGNENWQVTASDGHRYVVSFGPRELASKREATRLAYAHAEHRGVPAPRLVFFDRSCALADDAVVRILTWIDGAPLADVLVDASASTRFFRDLGVALRSLHTAAPMAGFSSRLDGSAPVFGRWPQYVAWRLDAIVHRALRAGVFTATELLALADQVNAIAFDLGDVVEPAVCHRDLHEGNLLAGSDGSLAALLDFDLAEAWDPAVDFVKLRWQVCPEYYGSESDLLAGYCGGSELPARWDDRLRVVEMLELVNVIANARLDGDVAFETSARERLAIRRSA